MNQTPSMLAFAGTVLVLTLTSSLGNASFIRKNSVQRLAQASSSRLWDISPPDISYVGLQLNLDYTVRDQVEDSDVSIELFRDDDCERAIRETENTYITTDIVNDLTPIGDGSGTRTMSVNLNIDPQEISSSRIISYTDVQAIVSFCVKFNLRKANSLTTPVAVGLDLTDDIGITGIIEDEEEKYGAEAYECDENLNAIEDPPRRNQGDSIRICVRPDEFARGFGVVMRAINMVRFERGDVSQRVIEPNSVVQDNGKTEYRCTAGQPLCHLEAKIGNDFYYSRGTVRVVGLAWLQYQYGGIRKLVQVPVRTRQMRQAGGFIGARDFSLSFEVEPSSTGYQATTYECNNKNQALTTQQQNRKKTIGDTIRICVVPDQAASERGVYMREISFFFFEQGQFVQFAVESTGETANDGKTIVICNPGDPICVFKTTLADGFFESELDITAEGQIVLQFGTGDGTETESNGSRKLQVIDAGFAGRTNVAMSFRVNPNAKPKSERTWQEQAEDWWLNAPVFLRIIYILALILVFLIILCFMWAICCGLPSRSPREKEVEVETSQENEEPKIVVQPIYVSPPPREEEEYNSETENHCDDVHTEEGGMNSTDRTPPSTRKDVNSEYVSPKPRSRRSPKPRQSKATRSPKRRSSRSSRTDEDGALVRSPKPRSSRTVPQDDGIRVSQEVGDGDGVTSGSSRKLKSVGRSRSPKSRSSSSRDGDQVRSPKRRSSRRRILEDDGIRVSQEVGNEDGILVTNQDASSASRSRQKTARSPRSSTHSRRKDYSKSPGGRRATSNGTSPGPSSRRSGRRAADVGESFPEVSPL